MNYSRDQENVVFQGLSNLLKGYEEGNLVLMASYELCEFFVHVLKNERDKVVMNYLGNHNAFSYSTNWNTVVVIKDADPQKHEIEISFFDSTSKIQPPTLLCENLNDSQFYYKLCSYLSGNSENINGKNIRGGGGSTLADELENIVLHNDSFCLAIVDSDEKYPNCPSGGTYKAVMDKTLDLGANNFIYKINVHEIENLVPSSYLLGCTRKNKKSNRFVQKILSLSNKDEILKYYDIKDGISFSAIQSNPEYYAFAEMIYNSFLPKNHKEEFKNYLCKMKKTGYVFPSINSKLLEYFLNKPDFSKSDYYLQQEYKNIKNIVFTFLCSRVDDPIN